MKMSATDQTDFPKLKQYVKSSLPKVADLPVIRSAMLEIAQLNHAKLRHALAWAMSQRSK
jgi:hypothetical protein